MLNERKAISVQLLPWKINFVPEKHVSEKVKVNYSLAGGEMVDLHWKKWFKSPTSRQGCLLLVAER